MVRRFQSLTLLFFALVDSLALGRRARATSMAERALALDSTPRPIQYRCAAGLWSRNHGFSRAQQLEQRAVEVEPLDRFDLWCQAGYCVALGRYDDAIERYRRYLDKSRDKRKRQYRSLAAIARVYRRLSEPDTLGHWRDVVANWEAALAINDRNSADWHLLGEAYLAINEPDHARRALEQANARLPAMHHRALARFFVSRLLGIQRRAHNRGLHSRALERIVTRVSKFCQSPNAVGVWYDLGRCFEQLGKPTTSSRFYGKAVHNSFDPAVQIGGIGVLHAREKRWALALGAFKKLREQQPERADVSLQIAHVYRRIGQYADATRYYDDALAAGADAFECRFYSGLALEYDDQAEAAADEYGGGALEESARGNIVHYRLGRALTRASRYRAACRAFLKTDNDNRVQLFRHHIDEHRDQAANDQAPADEHVDPTRWWRRGIEFETTGDWPDAACCFQAAIDREPDHCPEGQYLLGHALFKNAAYQNAALAFSEMCIDRDAAVDPHGSVFTLEPPSIPVSYVHYRNDLAIRRNVVIYESYDSVAIRGNPRAIFEQRSLFDPDDTWLHVWVISNRRVIPVDWQARPNVVFVFGKSRRYINFLASVEYIINNSGVPSFFVRRAEQRFLNTWHGTPLKTLGKGNKTRFNRRGGMQREFLQTTHMISPNRHTTDVVLDEWDLRPIYTGLLAETGYPRIDLTVNATDTVKSRVRERLGLHDQSPIVLFAPTWRGTHDAPDMDLERLKFDLRAMRDTGAQLVFRGHHLLEQQIESLAIDCTVAANDIDSNELLSIVDILVTDYSSVCVDFLTRRKPVIYYAYDQAEYTAERGFYILPNELPGTVCPDRTSLVDTLQKSIDSPANGADTNLSRFNPHDDGLATARAIDFFFHGDTRRVVHDARDTRRRFNALIYPGAFDNDRTSASLDSLFQCLEPSHLHPMVAFVADAIETYPERRARFERLPPSLAMLPRDGVSRWTAYERRCMDDARRDNVAALSSAHERIIARAFAREFRRLTGCARFDAVVDLSGYDWAWSATLAYGHGDFARFIYLYGDMREAQRSRFFNLLSTFAVYDRFDALVSADSTAHTINRERLAADFGIDPGRFICAGSVVEQFENRCDIPDDTSPITDDHLKNAGT